MKDPKPPSVGLQASELVLHPLNLPACARGAGWHVCSQAAPGQQCVSETDGLAGLGLIRQEAVLPCPGPGAVKDIRALLNDRAPLLTARGMHQRKQAVDLPPDRYDVVSTELPLRCL